MQIAIDRAETCLSLNNHLKLQNNLILSADTMVIVDGVPYGKPFNADEAARYLRLLSGRSHFVNTGLCFLNCKTFEQFCSLTTTKIQMGQSTT